MKMNKRDFGNTINDDIKNFFACFVVHRADTIVPKGVIDRSVF